MSSVSCSMCAEVVPEDRAIVGDSGVICVDCVWMCVDILDERGEKRPPAGAGGDAKDDGDEFDEKSEVHPRGSIPPPK